MIYKVLLTLARSYLMGVGFFYIYNIYMYLWILLVSLNYEFGGIHNKLAEMEAKLALISKKLNLRRCRLSLARELIQFQMTLLIFLLLLSLKLKLLV